MAFAFLSVLLLVRLSYFCTFSTARLRLSHEHRRKGNTDGALFFSCSEESSPSLYGGPRHIALTDLLVGISRALFPAVSGVAFIYATRSIQTDKRQIYAHNIESFKLQME